ncbi:MAG: hypothetical protein WDO69_24325 [Pseudomonadota bacterium]
MNASKKPTISREARRLVQRALGGKNESDADDALSLIFESLIAEAEVINDEGTLTDDSRELLMHAHVGRLKALKELIDGCVTVKWTETAPTPKAGLRSFPKDGAS